MSTTSFESSFKTCCSSTVEKGEEVIQPTPTTRKRKRSREEPVPSRQAPLPMIPMQPDPAPLPAIPLSDAPDQGIPIRMPSFGAVHLQSNIRLSHSSQLVWIPCQAQKFSFPTSQLSWDSSACPQEALVESSSSEATTAASPGTRLL